MKKIKIGNLLEGSEISLGCMRMNALSTSETESLLKVSMN